MTTQSRGSILDRRVEANTSPRESSVLPSLTTIIEAYGLQAKKSLGQHFLLDPSLLKKIVQSAGNINGTHLIEIGPGPGGLTRAMLESEAASLTVVEKDQRCVEALGVVQQHYDMPFTIIDGDALKVDLTQEVQAPRAMIANLPYNVGTDMLLNWLQQIIVDPTAFQSLTLMFQKEVAERISAAPNTKSYGRLSVLAQWCCHTHYLFDVPAGAFSPPPKVTSAIVHLTPRKERIAVDPETLEKVVKQAFSQRRKMLRASLRPLHENVEAWCEQAGIAPTARPETLSVQQFCDLANGF